MKRIYALALAAMCCATVNAQNARTQAPLAPDPGNVSIHDVTGPSEASRTIRNVVDRSTRGTGDYFSEDFSNGFDGNNTYGPWTFDGQHGNLWFITFPDTLENGYNPNVSIANVNPAYGDSLPNWWTGSSTIDSPTAIDGFAMLDADRYNSIRASASQPAAQVALTQTEQLVSELVSPVIDMTSAAGTGAELSFETSFRNCCANTDDRIALLYSFDGGDTWDEEGAFNLWTTYGGENNVGYRVTAFACITPLLEAQEDLTQFRFKFRFGGTQSHYVWMIDDIRITPPPQADLSIGATYLNDHVAAFADTTLTWTQYYRSFEYEFTPSYLTKPWSFGAVVRNICSQNTLSNVQVRATITAPDGSIEEVLSTPVDVAQGESFITYSEPFSPAAWSGMNATGTYTVSYEALMEEEDELPDNNIGINRSFVITDDFSAEDGLGGIVRNGSGFSGTSNAGWITQNVLIGAPFIFDEPEITGTVITHVEVAFLDWRDFTTLVEEVVFFNVRIGEVFQDNPTPENPNPTPVSVALFGSDNFQYTDAELEYIIQEEDLNDPDATPGLNNWASFELPSPVLIQPDVVYMPEINIPAGIMGASIAFIGHHSTRQEEGGYLARPRTAATGVQPNRWYFLAGNNAPAFRFRTSSALNVDKVTYDAGIKLTQNYPNPFVDQTRFMLQLDRTERVRLEVRDVTGKLIHSDDLGTIGAGVAYPYTLQRGSMAKGLYTYTVIAGEQQVTRKLMVE